MASKGTFIPRAGQLGTWAIGSILKSRKEQLGNFHNHVVTLGSSRTIKEQNGVQAIIVAHGGGLRESIDFLKNWKI